MCGTICGRFCPDEGAVAGDGNRIRAKYTAKWDVQIAGMIFQTGSSTSSRSVFALLEHYGVISCKVKKSAATQKPEAIAITADLYFFILEIPKSS